MFKEYNIPSNIKELQILRNQIEDDFEYHTIFFRDYIDFFDEYIKEAQENKWTSRFAHSDAIKIPIGLNGSNIVPVYLTKIESRYDNTKKILKGYSEISPIVIGNIEDWPKNHPCIEGSGYESIDNMVEDLSKIYKDYLFDRKLCSNDVIYGWKMSNYKSK